MKRILVVAAHSDDEALGCGGTLRVEAENGAVIRAVFLTNGIGARSIGDDRLNVERRRAASRKAAKILGIDEITQLDFPDNRLDAVPLLDIVQSLETVISDFMPTVVLTHWRSDLNVDHRICHQAILTACRPQRGHSVGSIITFEVPSSTEWGFSATDFSPNLFVDISSTLKQKLLALEAYNEEMRPWPHPRSSKSVTALAQWRGATVGCEAAEAFSITRLKSKGVP